MASWRFVVLTIVVLARVAAAAGVPVRYPEGPAHGFLVIRDTAGTALAHGELIQWLERRIVASRLVFRFDDGSLYDETVRFTQQPVFRIVRYRLVQHGPSFTETTDVAFDRAGRYRVRHRPRPDADLEVANGRADLPEDVSNGMMSMLLKNLSPGASARVHMVAFRPKPTVLEVALEPEGSDEFMVGPASERATRFLVRPRVGGMTGVLATVAGKQPPSLRVWIAQGVAPVLVRFEGPLYADGPTWRVELDGPRWPRE